MKQNRKKPEKKMRPGKNGGQLVDGYTENGGRPPKLLKQLNDQLKQEGYQIVKPSQMQEALELLLNLPEEKIKSIVLDKDIPFFLRVIGKKMISSKGDEAIEKILDRTLGRPKLSIDHTSGGEKINKKYESLTVDQIEKIFEERGLPKPKIDEY
jgi:hypothetical protein